MEDDQWDFNSIFIKFLVASICALKTAFSYLCSFNSDPLFSILITLYTLTLLYLPGQFVGIVFSPVLNSTGILLITVLRLGAIQRLERESNSTETEQPEEIQVESDSVEAEQTHQNSTAGSNSDHETEVGFEFDSDPGASFVEWHVGAPLEVIFEEYEGEEDDRNDAAPPEDREEKRDSCIQRYPSLSLYYPESDSDNSSDGDFPGTGEWESRERLSFSWDEEDREGGMIEIAIDGKRKGEAFRVEEENMIEIDISPARNKEFADEKW